MKWLLAFAFTIWSFGAFAQTNCLVPSSFPATPVVSTVAEGTHILKPSSGCLIAVSVTSGAVSGYLLVYNSITAPVDGTVTPIECVPVGANSLQFINFAPQPPEFYSVGISVVYSTTGCFIQTTSATAFFHALIQ